MPRTSDALFGAIDYNYLAQDSDLYWAFANMVMNIQFP
jgi:hypothetical protein